MLRALFMLAATASIARIVFAASPTTVPAASALGPYCGIHCVYAAMVAEGVEAPITQLLNRRYLGCPLGSSFEELEHAASDHGLYARPVTDLSTAALRSLLHPAILFVRSEPADPE